MSRFAELVHRVGTIGRRGDYESRLDDEMRFHIEQQASRNIAAGMDTEAAFRAAERKFGGVDRMKEMTRDEFRATLLEDTTRDLGYGVRTLRRAPGFAIVSMLTLALGIGAATSVFTVVNSVLLKPLPYPEPDRIVRLFQLNANHKRNAVSDANFQDWRTQTRSFSGMAEMAQNGDLSVLAGSEASRARVTMVSADFFDVMQTRPVQGRAFARDDQHPGAAPVAVVSDAFWRRALGAGRVNGQTIRFEQTDYQVVGVMPAGFDYPDRTEIWTPTELFTAPTSRTAQNFSVVARLAPNVKMADASADLGRVSRRIADQYGDDNWMRDAEIVSLRENLTSDARPVLLVLFGAAAFLLLIACANVSSLLLARAATRKRELSVRLALGAGRVAVFRQMLAESLVLCIAGGALGVMLATWGVRLLLFLDAGSLPRAGEIRIDGVAILFALGISVSTAVVLGAATSMRNSGADLRSLISSDGRTLTGSAGSQRMRDMLVVAQVALTIVLLFSAGLLARSFMRVLSIDPGFNTEDALVMDMAMDGAGDAASIQRQVQFQTELLARMAQMPGVKQAALTNAFPLGGGNYSNGQFIEMNAPDEIRSYDDFRRLSPADVASRAGNAGLRIVSDDYFAAMSIPIIRGRGFQRGDDAGAPEVAVISESLAREKWPARDPIGRYIQFGNMDGDMRGLRVVGVVGDVREFGPEALPQPLIYANYRQRPVKAAAFSVIARGPDPSRIMVDARRMVHDMDAQLPVVTRTMHDAVDSVFAGRRFSLAVIGAFSAVALMLAMLGLYGVISYLVAQRRREIGIRNVLGAPTTALMSLVAGKAARLTILGAIIGAFASFACARVLRGMLFGGVTFLDLPALAGVCAAIAFGVFAATALPVRRALRISPLMALRDD